MDYDTVLLKCSEAISDLLIPELQKGFYILSVEGHTVFDFLVEDCCINSTYISEKIKTIFINGGPVDDIFNTRIKDGENFALSGAMPGIVGAMMRIGSPYAPMRESITVKPGAIIDNGKKIFIGLKLFNVILSEKGMEFLHRGIILTRQRFFDFLTRNKNLICSECRTISINSLFRDISFIYDPNQNLNEFILLKIEPVYESKS